MSERGSFVTEYIYCPDCFEGAKKILLDRNKFLCSITIPSWESKDKELPIIAGKIGGLYKNEEFHTFENELNPQLEKELCHSLRIVVLSDSAEEELYIIHGKKKPKNEWDDKN